MTIQAKHTLVNPPLAQWARSLQQCDRAPVTEARVLAWQHYCALLCAQAHNADLGVVQLDAQCGHVLDRLFHIGAALAGGVAAVL